jgi:hypothetical protein
MAKPKIVLHNFAVIFYQGAYDDFDSQGFYANLIF